MWAGLFSYYPKLSSSEQTASYHSSHHVVEGGARQMIDVVYTFESGKIFVSETAEV